MADFTEDLSFLDENYKRIKDNIAEAAVRSGRTPEDVRLMAVTKTVEPEYINRVTSLGADLIGENKVQELLGKLEFLNTDGVEMHIIGHLQTNKVRKIVGTVSMIQSVDSIPLAEEISLRSTAKGVETGILLEVNIGGELSKTGLDISAAEETAFAVTELDGIRLKGFMAIPPVCETEAEVRQYFARMYRLYSDMKEKLNGRADISVLSMGMSSDYVPAILEGANLVRVGSSLFGARRY